MPHRQNSAIENNPQTVHQPEQTFFGLGIAPKILDILDRICFKKPTPIQSKVIPLGLQGKDLIGIAQTGTGKTHSFAIPMIQRLAQIRGVGLVLAPTRELALQIDEAFQGLAPAFGMQTACLIGGASMPEQIKAIRKRPRVIIATPGRLIDHIERRTIMLAEVVVLVLDEADRMLDMGFLPQIEQIMRYLTRERQTMLFSATIPQEIMAITAKYMKLPLRVEVAPSGTTAEKVTQELFIVKREAKLPLLSKLLAQYQGSVLLFSRTKHNAHKITRAIKGMGHHVAEIHSDRSLNQRREALDGFKDGKYRVLVATDIAARGIDVTGIELVINFDLPDDADNYVHRIGRTGRAGCPGHAISFATPDQSRDVRDIEKVIRTQIPVAKHPDISTEQFDQSGHPSGGKRFGGGGHRGQRQFRPHRSQDGQNRHKGGQHRSGGGQHRPQGGSHRPQGEQRPSGGHNPYAGGQG